MISAVRRCNCEQLNVHNKFRALFLVLDKRISTSSDDYQYLQKSKLSLQHFQQSLPRLPIPPLEKTCHRYLNALKPLLSNEQFQQTEGIVRRFQEKDGRALNEQLVTVNKKNKHTSYITKAWFDMYLQSRDSITINVNPFMGVPNDPKPEYNNQLIRASNILISSLRFLRSLRSNLLEPEVYHLNPAKSDNETFRRVVRIVPNRFAWHAAFLFKAFPLDVSQYQSLFNGTRIPKHGQDELFNDPTAKHMLIIRNGHFYVFDVLDSNGHIKDPAYIHGCLHHILTDRREKVENPLAALTSLDRDSWATLRQHLVDIGNADALRLIDSAVFSMVLLDEAMNEDPVKMCHVMLHGDGTNYWFDKCIELIIAKDKVAMSFEHSWGDGVAVVRYVDNVVKDSIEKPFIHPNSTPASIDSSVVRCLEFKMDEEIKDGIQMALERLNKAAQDLDFKWLLYHNFGKDFIKKQKLSPDAILQLAFQMAYYRQHGKTVATYESCSTAAFKHGRTETIRPATVATKNCTLAFAEKNAPAAKLRKLMEECSQVHNTLTKEAATGHGFDRHLFMLRRMADPHNLPELFRDPAYQLINHIILSTSTVSNPVLEIAGFGPVTPNGLGVAYVVNNDSLGAMVSSHPSLSDAGGFIDCFHSALDDIHKVLLQSKK